MCREFSECLLFRTGGYTEGKHSLCEVCVVGKVPEELLWTAEETWGGMCTCNLGNKLNVMVPEADWPQFGFNPVCIIQSDFSSDDWQFYLTYFDSVFRLIEEAWTPPAEGEQ